MKETGWTVFDKQMNPSQSVLEAEEVLHSMRRHYEKKIREIKDKIILISYTPGDKIICLSNTEVFLILEEADFVIDKVHNGIDTYRIVNPIHFRSYIGVHYTGANSWYLDLYPRYGFHLLSHSLCLGDIKIKPNQPKSYYISLIPTLKEMWRGVNLNSLGSVISLPVGVDERWASVSNGVDYLLREGLISKIDLTEDAVPQNNTEEV